MSAQPSYYQPRVGEEFFLLSETSYGTGEEATVRIEISRQSADVYEYGGVDIALYRIPDPIAFLKAQRNLHRVKVPGKLQPEGMANMLRVSWDKIWANSRYAWKTLFSADARKAATEAAPDLKSPEDLGKRTPLSYPPAYAKIPGLDLVDRFRYPVQSAKPIEAPKGVQLDGSSSEFLPQDEGNVRIPLGKRAPGLYLVEAYVGKHRAVTLLFVSDSVAITKNTAGEMLAWVAQRQTGAPVADAEVAWSDGVGVLKSGRTGSDGVVRLNASSPETSYVFGVDPKGGVFISENFYHDSEIYNAKLYAVTDRPLYRPGDLVQVKFLGREFKNSRTSTAVPSGTLDLLLMDPTGTQVLAQKVAFDGAKGGETSFRLPPNAEAGGWDIVFSKGNDRYGAAFRVANYVKPHFEIDVTLEKPEFKTKEAVNGRIRLVYPDGSPVANATIRLTARAQALTMVEGELRYGGQFPVAIKADELKTDRDGVAAFSLPPASDPSRYILSLLAEDGAAYRVRATKEVLIERGASLWQLAAPAYFSTPGQSVEFKFSPVGAQAPASRPSRWEILRLEDRQQKQGEIPASGETVKLDFAEAGSYTVSLRDAKGNLLAATSHWVSGEGMKAVPGSVEIVFDKEKYVTGETAHALITFPSPVDNALLTLERDRVEATALLGRSGGGNWLTLTQLAPTQWRADIPVREDYGPNVTFSVLYVKDGDYVFQNKGLRVAVPAIEIVMKPGKEKYAPGDTVSLEIETQLAGKPIAAQVTLGVVDEMIYVLQPEIAPTIGQFFYHPRRNNVRTAASLSFIGYDLARMPGKGGAPVNRAPSERGVKVLERPRRDDTDTAAWFPSIQTDASGKATVSFRVPDALTRWRMTARAMSANGVVGQNTRYVESYKPFYAKWSGPATFRQGDRPGSTIVAFNQTGSPAKVQLLVAGKSPVLQKELTLQPGANSIPFTFDKPVNGELDISLRQDGNAVDSLRQTITVLAPGWLSERALSLELGEANANDARLDLPADARDIKLSLSQGAAGQFARIADDLLTYPWGCVEQTASRLLPLSFVYRGLPGDAPRLRELSQTLATQRLRLVQMAGPDAIFGWWGTGTGESAWLTAYAYYADWHASRALGLKLPPRHWEQVASAYTKFGKNDPLALRALSVWFMQEMELPVKTLVDGLVKDAEKLPAPTTADFNPRNSRWLGSGDKSSSADAITLVLIAQLAKQQQVAVSTELGQRVDGAREVLRAQGGAGTALLAMEGKVSRDDAGRALAALGPALPTLDRALALAWWNKALGGTPTNVAALTAPEGTWQALGNALGAPTWRWTGDERPTAIHWPTPPTSPLTAIVRYRSAEKETAKLPVTIERKLYRLVATKAPAPKAANGEGNNATPPSPSERVEFTLGVVMDDALRANELYLEEVRLRTDGTNGDLPRFGLLEVPLPPGADVEPGTWGIRIKDLNGNGEVLPIERARYQPGELSYAVPVDRMSNGMVIRHLVRFGSRGEFVLPPARFYRMYQPEEKAFEGVAERRLTVK